MHSPLSVYFYIESAFFRTLSCMQRSPYATFTVGNVHYMELRTIGIHSTIHFAMDNLLVCGKRKTPLYRNTTDLPRPPGFYLLNPGVSPTPVAQHPSPLQPSTPTFTPTPTDTPHFVDSRPPSQPLPSSPHHHRRHPLLRLSVPPDPDVYLLPLLPPHDT